MNLIGIKAENFKKLKLVDVKFDPKSKAVIISGDNRQGKSTLLDAVEAAFGGAKALKDTPLPIRRGEDHAKVVAETDELIVTRTWTSAGNSYVTVTNKDGWTPSGGVQTLLDKLYSAFSFDPLAFSLMPENKQRETLLKLIDIGIDLNDWKSLREDYYTTRTQVNREITDLEGQIKLMADVPADTPDEEVSTATVLEEQQKAQAVKNANDEARDDVQNNREYLLEKQREEQDLAARCRDLEASLKLAQKARAAVAKVVEDLTIAVNTRESEIAALKDPDMTVFPAKLAALEDTNRKVRIKKKRQELQASLAEKTIRSQGLTDAIAEMDVKREDAIKNAKMPVPGLSFDDHGLIYNGIPATQWSDEEAITVSVAMGMSLNPKLKAMFIREASLLSEKSRERLVAMAAEHGYTVFMEVVDTSGKLGVYIENGEVKAIDGQAVEQPKAKKSRKGGEDGTPKSAGKT